MLKIDRKNQNLSLLEAPSLAESDITERYDLQEFIANSSDEFFKEIGEELFLIGKEVLPSTTVQDRIDLLAIDKSGMCVVIELKRGNNKLQMMQAISYAGMVSHWSPDDFLDLLNEEEQDALVDFLDCDKDDLNRRQRVILIAEAYDYALLIGAEWLSERFGVNISCCRVSVATDPTTNSEYLVCSNVYPAPELAAESISRGRGSSERPPRWSDWGTALENIENPALKSFFENQLEIGIQANLSRRVLRFQVNGKRRLHVSARKKNAYVWQVGRFTDDVEYWSSLMSDAVDAKPVKSGRCLRLYLETAEDFAKFENAVNHQLNGVTWTGGSEIEFDTDED